MRQTIKGLVAAIAVMTAGAAPAMACGFDGCGGGYASGYGYGVGYGYGGYGVGIGVGYGGGYGYDGGYGYAGGYGGGYGCGSCGTGWGYATLAEPTTQYYYVNQGPTYSGPASIAPPPVYQESALPAYSGYARPSYGYRSYRPWHRYGYAPRRYYAPRHYGYRYGNEGYYSGRPLVRRYY